MQGDSTREIDIDLERVIDDFIFMFFYVGNDFLPNLPCLDIREGSLALLFKLYLENFVQYRRFLTCHGKIDWNRAQLMFQLIGICDTSYVFVCLAVLRAFTA